MSTDPTTLTEAEAHRLYIAITNGPVSIAGCAVVHDLVKPVVESILSACAAALRADIARDIEAQCLHTIDGVTACDRCADAARIALGGTDE